MPESLFSDGFDTTLVLTCGCTLRIRNDGIEKYSVPFKVGDWLSCWRHSAAVGYDHESGDTILGRDKQVTEARRES